MVSTVLSCSGWGDTALWLRFLGWSLAVEGILGLACQLLESKYLFQLSFFSYDLLKLRWSGFSVVLVWGWGGGMDLLLCFSWGFAVLFALSSTWIWNTMWQQKGGVWVASNVGLSCRITRVCCNHLCNLLKTSELLSSIVGAALVASPLPRLVTINWKPFFTIESYEACLMPPFPLFLHPSLLFSWAFATCGW